MFGFLVFLVIVVSILLMIVVLMQSSKGGGLAGSFGTGQVGAVFGVRRTADFLSRATTILAAMFMILCLIINIFFLPGKAKNVDSVIQRGSTQSSTPRAIPPSSQPAANPQQQGK